MRTVTILISLAAVLLISGCIMPDRKEQVAKNEAKLAEEGYVQLKAGDQAPPVELMALDGTVLLGGESPASGPVLLFFVTATDTPNSAKEVHQLNRLAAELGTAGVTAAVVLPVGDGQAADYQAAHCPDLLVVADPDLAASIPFGCAVDGAELLQRTQVGIDADGGIAFFERGFPLNSAKLVLEAFGISTTGD